MQQKFLNMIKINAGQKTPIFEKKCKKLPIDKCKNLLWHLLKTCDNEKFFKFRKNINIFLEDIRYGDNAVNIFISFHFGAIPPKNWRHFFVDFRKKLSKVNLLLRNTHYTDRINKINEFFHFISAKPFKNWRIFLHLNSKKLKNNHHILRNVQYSENVIHGVIYLKVVNCGTNIFNTPTNRYRTFHLIKPVQIPIKWPEINFLNFNNFFRKSVYYDHIHDIVNIGVYLYFHFLNLKNNVGFQKKPRYFFSKNFYDLLEFQRKKIRNVNDFLTITRYSKDRYIHINKFLKISFGVQSPVPRRKRTPVSMFKKSIYIINVFINHSTDALRAPSINKIGDYLHNTIFKKELLVLFFNLLKKYFRFYLNYPKSIKNQMGLSI